ncbi:MAG: DNA polymerase III subunit gamma/tau [Alistipes sp.]|nr:DNA polymerase III subunit gamma/tau [Alistipes sp.]
MISGTSLAALINGAAHPEQESAETVSAAAAAPLEDPAAEQKLTAAHDAIFDDIRQRRPRFVAAFDNMTFAGSSIRLTVPSQALFDEIMRSKTEILMRIAEIAGVNGMLTLDIAVDERMKAARPIKLEDRVKYLTDKNPLVAELRKALDLETE